MQQPRVRAKLGPVMTHELSEAAEKVIDAEEVRQQRNPMGPVGQTAHSRHPRVYLAT